MALTDSMPTQDSGGLTVTDERLIQAGEVMRSATGIPRLGVLPAHTGALVTGNANLTVNVLPFVGVASRTGGATAEKLANDASTLVTVGAAPGSNSRIDVVYFKPQFVASGDANNVPVFGVQAGTAAASPTKPSLPSGAVELATILIPSSATTMQSAGVVITTTALYTTAIGGTVVFRNDTEMAAFAPVAGTQGWRLDTKQMWTYDGANWTLSQAGMLLIRPTNIVGGTIDASGTIIMAGGTALRVDGCFSSLYRHYRIISRNAFSANGNVRMTLTSGGVERQTNYRAIAAVAPGTSGSNVTSFAEGPNAINWFLTTVQSTKKMLTLDLFNPGIADETYGLGNLASWGGANVESEQWSGAHETSVANDGFRFFNQEGAAFTSADIKIYAYG